MNLKMNYLNRSRLTLWLFSQVLPTRYLRGIRLKSTDIFSYAVVMRHQESTV